LYLQAKNFTHLRVARGTSEPGSFGLIVGDPLVAAVKRQVPGARGYAVQYPADATAQSAPTGRDDVVKRLEAQSAACPQQKFALVGYSQGAMVMRMAAPKIPAAIHSKILALEMFGDPGLRGGRLSSFPGDLTSRLYENCAKGDPVCTTGTEFQPHLTYRQSKYQDPSAKFMIAAFKGQPMAALTCPETASCALSGGGAAKGAATPKMSRPGRAVAAGHAGS